MNMKEATTLAEQIYEEIPRWTRVEDRHYQMGLLRKDVLIDGEEYIGACRNANTAKWLADKQQFEYIKQNFGFYFPETVPHPEDEKGFDVFVPVIRVADLDEETTE